MSREELTTNLTECANYFQHWLDLQLTDRQKEGLDTSDNNVVMRPPTWPTRGLLKRIIATLNEARELTEQVEDAYREAKFYD